MKVQIRNSVFETNSSSTHAICINTNGELKMPAKESMTYGRAHKTQLRAEHKYDFGWEEERYYDFEHKFDYLWHAVINAYSGYIEIVGYKDENKWYPIYKEYSTEDKIKMIFDAKKKIIGWLEEEGYEIWMVNPIVEYIDRMDLSEGYSSYISVPRHPDNEYDSYIDHGSETLEFVKGVLSDKKIFMAYLFCEDSCVCTGSDNYDGPAYPEDMSKYDIQYYKGN